MHSKGGGPAEFWRLAPATRLAQTTANNTLLQTISCNKLRIAHMLLRLCCKVLGTASLTRSHDFSHSDCCCTSHVWECEVHRHSTNALFTDDTTAVCSNLAMSKWHVRNSPNVNQLGSISQSLYTYDHCRAPSEHLTPTQQHRRQQHALHRTRNMLPTNAPPRCMQEGLSWAGKNPQGRPLGAHPKGTPIPAKNSNI